MADLLAALKDLDRWVTDWLAQIHQDRPGEERLQVADDMASDWFGSGMGASFQMQIAEAEKVAQADDWQPIDTAPKDGTKFLGYWPGLFGDDTDTPVKTWWEDRQWQNPYDEATPELGDAPTHWRPLIAPPASEAT